MVDPAVHSKVKAPATALMVLAVLGLLYSLFSIFTSALSGEVYEGVLEEMRRSLSQSGQELPPFLESLFLSGSSIGVALAILNAALWIFVLFGALRMRQFRSRSLCVTAAVLTLAPIQCCCGLGIATGIWALVVLNREDVRQSFSDA